MHGMWNFPVFPCFCSPFPALERFLNSGTQAECLSQMCSEITPFPSLLSTALLKMGSSFATLSLLTSVFQPAQLHPHVVPWLHERVFCGSEGASGIKTNTGNFCAWMARCTWLVVTIQNNDSDLRNHKTAVRTFENLNADFKMVLKLEHTAHKLPSWF